MPQIVAISARSATTLGALCVGGFLLENVMPRTFTNEPLGKDFRYTVATESGHYCMGKSWIDTTCPNDMMDYDFTQSIEEAKVAAAETHRMWCSMQATL